MKEETVSVGVRVTNEGIEFFGTEEVNDLLGRGWKVAAIQPDEAMVEEIPASSVGDEAEYALVGFSVSVSLNSSA